MVQFVQNVDSNNKIYISKALRKAGFDGSIVIIPGFKAAVMYPEGTNLEAVEQSICILLEGIRLRQKSSGVDLSESL